jgi:hypothetical protein
LPQALERFKVWRLSEQPGKDHVALQCLHAQGQPWLSAPYSQQGHLQTRACKLPSANEQFEVVQQPGDKVALRNIFHNTWVTAVDGGGEEVLARKPRLGTDLTTFTWRSVTVQQQEPDVGPTSTVQVITSVAPPDGGADHPWGNAWYRLARHTPHQMQ